MLYDTIWFQLLDNNGPVCFLTGQYCTLHHTVYYYAEVINKSNHFPTRGALAEWLERLAYDAESRRKV